MTVRLVCFSPFRAGTDVSLLHEPYNSFSRTVHALLLEFCMDARTPIHAPVVLIRIFNTLYNLFIIPFSLAYASFAPIEIPIF